jgi:hypothetical protein
MLFRMEPIKVALDFKSFLHVRCRYAGTVMTVLANFDTLPRCITVRNPALTAATSGASCSDAAKFSTYVVRLGDNIAALTTSSCLYCQNWQSNLLQAIDEQSNTALGLN